MKISHRNKGALFTALFIISLFTLSKQVIFLTDYFNLDKGLSGFIALIILVLLFVLSIYFYIKARRSPSITDSYVSRNVGWSTSISFIIVSLITIPMGVTGVKILFTLVMRGVTTGDYSDLMVSFFLGWIFWIPALIIFIPFFIFWLYLLIRIISINR